MIDLLLTGAEIVFQPGTFLLIVMGTIIGVIFGSLPGVSASMAVVLGMTFTYNMDPLISIAFLVAVYCAAITGGSITAILFKIPGTPASAVTTFDGYPMVQQGLPTKALSISLVSSAFGGIVAAISMFLISPQLSKVALSFGPSELFAVAFLGLSVLTALNQNSVIKTLISALIGLFLATVGMDPISGDARFTWGNSTLLSGIEMIPVMIGMFALTQVLKETKKSSKIDPDEVVDIKNSEKFDKDGIVTFKEYWSMKYTAIRSSIIGTLVGILPGAGATIASFLSYTAELKFSKDSSKYGKGEPKGIVASDTANNAATGGSMVPLLSLGIPGGNAAAVMMTALVMKGVQMGPLLLQTQPQYMSSVFSSMIVTNVVMVIVSLGIARIFGKILKIPYSTLGPIIILFAVVGSFALQNNTGMVFLMVIAGILGYAFNKFGFNSAALILGLVLGEMVESNLRRAIMVADGDVISVFTKPVTAVIMIVCLASISWPFIKMLIERMRKKEYAS